MSAETNEDIRQAVGKAYGEIAKADGRCCGLLQSRCVLTPAQGAVCRG
ncbi:MAG: hypothetical protein JSV65_05740 [Armatimonadota bacterium]|nr:MAG: hypothetical protein JSV65_05740 [Armatimonadota bacterium]